MSKPSRETATVKRTTDPTDDGSLTLLVGAGSGAFQVRLERSASVIIGRDATCDVVIEDETLSRRHAHLTLGTAMTLEDLQSTNGTFLLGSPVVPGDRAPVTIGGAFQLGSVTCVLQRAPALGAALAARPLVRAPARVHPDRILEDPAMRSVYAMLDLVADSPLSVLLLGETGVGKEIAARALHEGSDRSAAPFLQINCAAIPEALVESELFGHEKGAFTGAVQAKVGLFEGADGGTVFLDEIGELAIAAQAKILRVLETGEVTRLGSLRSRKTDVRIVAATNRDLRGMIAQSTFRADLFFRLNGVTVTIPPLRSRKADIAPLARHFVERAAARAGRPVPRLTAAGLTLLERHPWPGNVRELRMAVERAVVMTRAGQIDASDLARCDPSTFGGAEAIPAPPLEGADTRLRSQIRSVEEARIREALEKTGGNQSQAARLLGIARRTLLTRMDEFGLPRPGKHADRK